MASYDPKTLTQAQRQALWEQYGHCGVERDANGKFAKGNKGFWTGKKRPSLLITNAAKTMFKKGQASSNKKMGEMKNCLSCATEFYVMRKELLRGRGKYCSKKCYGDSVKGVRFSPSTEFESVKIWPGTRNEYRLLHKKIRKLYGEPMSCQQCGSVKNLQWANKSQQYQLDKNDWMQLCVKCHFYYDRKGVGYARQI